MLPAFDPATCHGLRTALNLRPYGQDGADWWLLSDLDLRRQERDHVTGLVTRRVPPAHRTAVAPAHRTAPAP